MRKSDYPKVLRRGVAVMVILLLLFGAFAPAAMAADWPRCQSGCDAKDASITNIWLVVAEPDCTPGTPTSAELWATFKVTRKKGICCVVSVVDIYVGPDLIEDDYTTNIGQDLPEGTYNRKIADITWTCGSKLTLKDIYAQWIPGGGQPCPSCRWNCDDYSIPAKCYYDAGPYEVPAPLIANFTFDNVCFCTYTQFTNETTGGVPPYTFDWNFGDGTPHDITENPSHHYGAADTYSVTLAVTDSNTTENTDSQSYDVTVYSKPTASASSNSPVCVGDTLTLTGGPDGMATYSWTGPNDFSSSDQSPTVSTSATLAMDGDYTLTVTDANDCTDYDTTTVVVYPKPTASASSNSPVCVGDTLTLTGGPDGMATYSWTGPNDFSSSDQSPTVSTSATLAMDGDYTLTVTDANDCTDYDTTTVVVYPKPTASASSNSPVCVGDTLTLTGGPDGMATYSWTGPNDFSSSDQSPTVSTSATLAMDGDYTLTVTDANDCTDYDTTTVVVYPKPTASASSNSPVCVGDTLTLTGGPDGMATYSWTGPNDFSSSDQSPTVSTSATLAMDGDYTLTVTDANDCTDYDTTTVVVYPKPTAGIEVDKTAAYALCPFDARLPAKIGDTVTYRFKVTNTGDVTLTGITVSDDLYGPVTIGTRTLAPGKSTKGKLTHVVVEDDYPSVTDTATATGTDPSGRTVTDTDECTVQVRLE